MRFPGLRSLVAALAVAAVGLWASECGARAMSVMDSFPMVNQIMDGSATSFAIRFDGPINHSASRLTLVTPRGTQQLRARLDSEPNTLYSSVGTLPAGDYQLRWEARSMDGEVSRGAIPFKVSPR
jgi:methionine-rich copper-binding protein CopC